MLLEILLSQSVTISITKTDDQNPSISSFSADTTSVALKTSDQSKTVTITATLTDNVGITSVSLLELHKVIQEMTTHLPNL